MKPDLKWDSGSSESFGNPLNCPPAPNPEIHPIQRAIYPVGYAIYGIFVPVCH